MDMEWARLVGKGKPQLNDDYSIKCQDNSVGAQGLVNYDSHQREVDGSYSVTWSTRLHSNEENEQYSDGAVKFSLEDGSDGLSKAVSAAKKLVSKILSAKVVSGAASRSDTQSLTKSERKWKGRLGRVY